MPISLNMFCRTHFGGEYHDHNYRCPEQSIILIDNERFDLRTGAYCSDSNLSGGIGCDHRYNSIRLLISKPKYIN